MKQNVQIEAINRNVSFIIDHLEEHLSKRDSADYYNSGIGNAFIELIMQLLILEKHEKLNHWCEEALKYYSELVTGDFINDAEQDQVLFYRYIISLLTGSENSDYLVQNIENSKKHYAEQFEMNEHSHSMYEALAVYLVTAGDYSQAKEYTEQLVKIKKGGLAGVIDRYLDIRESAEPLDKLAKECKKLLNKRKSELTYFLPAGLPYFLFYYRELLKSDSLVEPATALVLGIK